MKEYTINFKVTRDCNASILANSEKEAIAKIVKELDENGADTFEIEAEKANDFDVVGDKDPDPLELELFGEEIPKFQSIDWSELSHPEAIRCWFGDPCYDLSLHGETQRERTYLDAIDKMSWRTGANNLALVQYLWKLETKINSVNQRTSADHPEAEEIDIDANPTLSSHQQQVLDAIKNLLIEIEKLEECSPVPDLSRIAEIRDRLRQVKDYPALYY